MRYILRYKWNPIRISSLPEDEYDLYFNDFLMEAKNNPPITVAFIESVEDNGWGSQLTTSSHKENIAKLLNDLFIQDRANFKDPQVLNQLGLAAMPSKNFPHRVAFPFSLACFTAAYILDRSFLSAKRNLIEAYKIMKKHMRERNDGLFLGIPFQDIAKEMRVILKLK